MNWTGWIESNSLTPSPSSRNFLKVFIIELCDSFQVMLQQQQSNIKVMDSVEDRGIDWVLTGGATINGMF